MNSVTSEFLTDQGCEFYLRTVRKYAWEGDELCFWDIMARARAKNEVCWRWSWLSGFLISFFVHSSMAADCRWVQACGRAAVHSEPAAQRPPAHLARQGHDSDPGARMSRYYVTFFFFFDDRLYDCIILR